MSNSTLDTSKKSISKKAIIICVAGVSAIAGFGSSIISDLASDPIKEQINQIIRKTWYAKSIFAATEGRSSIIKADKLADEGKSHEAELEYARGLESLSSAANEGLSEAMRDLGRVLCIGREGYIAKDPVRAKIWIIKAADAGDTIAKDYLGRTCR